MSDKNITNSADEENDLSDLSDDDIDHIIAAISVPKAKETQHQHQNQELSMSASYSDKRAHPRHQFHWRVSIVKESGFKNNIFHGYTRDLSLSGGSILLDHNVFFTEEVVLLLTVPPTHIGQQETILEILCKTTYTILDSECGQFRMGVRFIHFIDDSKALLSELLKRQVPEKSTTSSTGAVFLEPAPDAKFNQTFGDGADDRSEGSQTDRHEKTKNHPARKKKSADPRSRFGETESVVVDAPSDSLSAKYNGKVGLILGFVQDKYVLVNIDEEIIRFRPDELKLCARRLNSKT